MSRLRRVDPKNSETTARLILTGDRDNRQAWLEPIVSAENCDLILEGKGDEGEVLVATDAGLFPVLTVDSLGNLEELAAVLAGITIEGADPAAVLALETSLKNLIDGLAKKPSGATVAEAVKAVYDAIAAIGAEPLAQSILNAFGGTVADLTAYIVGVDDNLATTTAMAFSAQSGLQQFLTVVSGNPDPSLITVANGGLAGLAGKAWEALVAQVDAGAVDEAAVNALIADALAGLNIDSAEPLAQQLIDIIGGKPQGGGTIADVAATFAALGQALMGAVGIEEAAVNALIQAALADLDLTGGGGGLDEAAVNTLIEKQLAGVGPIIMQAVQSQAGKVSDKLTLNSTKAEDGQFVIETNNLTAANWKVGVDFQTQRGGEVTVNGSRVLTTEDALETGGIDQAAVEAVVQAAIADSSDSGVISAAIGNLYNMLYNDEIIPIKDAVRLGFPHLQGQIDTSKTDLQILFYGITGYDAATANMAGAALEAIREGLKTLDGTLNTAYDYLIRVINDINGEILIGDAAIDGVGPALAKLRAESAKAQAFFNTVHTNVFGWDGNGAPPTAQEIGGSLASVIIELQGAISGIEGFVLDGQVYEAMQELLAAAGGGGGTTDLTAVLARLDTLEAENTALKAEVATLKTGLQGLEAGTAEAIQQIYDVELPSIQETMAAIVEYVIETYAEKSAVDSLDATLSALMQALGGNDPAEVAAAFAAFSENVGLAIDQGFEDRMPGILEALSQHLETVLAIFTSGGQPGQIVTPAQLTQLLADIARDYATKTQLADYAKVNDPNQIITAKSTILQGIQFSNSGEVLTPVNDDYGNRLRLLPADLPNGEDLPCVIVHTDLLDLFPDANKYATRSDVEGLMAGKPGAMQPLLDAINGPDATLDSVQKMFWLLDDIIMALLEATGIEMPKDSK